jgi:hypothetical protein
MTTSYSPSTKGFYIDEIHGGDVPDDAVEITPEEHRQLLDAQAEGKSIVFENGKPAAKHVEPPVEPIADQAARMAANVNPVLAKAAGITHAQLLQAATDYLTPAEWDAGEDYHVGELCTYQGKTYRALPDVSHSAPDDVFDLDADPPTGGWAPV